MLRISQLTKNEGVKCRFCSFMVSECVINKMNIVQCHSIRLDCPFGRKLFVIWCYDLRIMMNARLEISIMQHLAKQPGYNLDG